MTKITISLSLLGGLLLANHASAQPVQQFQRITYPVTVNGQSLKYPFAGGLNAPQFSLADLDHDLTQDLVVFDRVGNVVLPFINQGTAGEPDYVYTPEYAINFKTSLAENTGLIDWMLMRDFDQDGAMDIFCAALSNSSQEIQVFKGYYDQYGLKFTPYLFEYPASCDYCNPLLIFYPDDNPAFWNNFPVSRGDIPDVDDIDGDGDLDIVAFPAGVSTNLTMLRNMSVEHGNGLGKLEYELQDQCWGKFFENGMERCHARLSDDPNVCSNGFAPAPCIADDRDGLHPGATVTTFDNDNDGDKDLLLGNVTFACIDMMTNGSSPQNAWMTAQDTAFPIYNVPIDINTFPGTFYLDYDGDGKKDLIAALNNPTSGEDRKNVWLYRNTATAPGQHQFELQTRNLFTGDMIDLGTTAHPAFADVNADGLLDLVVGNYGFYSYANGLPSFTNARLNLFLNVGTPTAPAFELANNDWMGLSQFSPSDYDFSPTFGDIDGDEDLDLLVGSNIGGIYCYRNTAGPGQPMVLQYDNNPMWLGLDVIGSVSAPIVYDLDGDGLQDLLIGERVGGNVNFFKNSGTLNNPAYPSSPTLQRIGQIDTRGPLGTGIDPIGISTPAIVQTSDGPVIVVGALLGHLEAYYLGGATESPYGILSPTWGNIDVGNRSHPAFADLDDDGILEMVVGNQRGGLAMFKTELIDITVPLHAGAPEAPELQISPNPARGWVRVEWPVQGNLQWQAFNGLGQLVAQDVSPNGIFNVEVSNWPAGIYTLKATAQGVSATCRLTVVH